MATKKKKKNATKPNTVKATIKNATPKLAALLKEYTVFDSHETRCHSRKGDKLFIHMSRPRPTLNVEG